MASWAAGYRRSNVLKRIRRTRQVVRNLNQTFDKTRLLHDALTEDDLRDLGIRCYGLDLQNGTVTDGTTFYQPLPEKECPEINWEEAIEAFWRWHPSPNSEPRRVDNNLQVVTNTFWDPYFFEDKEGPWTWRSCHSDSTTVGFRESPHVHPVLTPYSWEVSAEVDNATLEFPHCSFRLTNFGEPLEALRRSEVLPLVAVMKSRMELWRLMNHHILPVLAISIFRSKARILQAYHDGHSLIISKSKFYDFKDEARGNLELFARWIHSLPIGDTLSPLPIEPEKLPKTTVKHVDHVLRTVIEPLGLAKGVKKVL